MAKRKRSRKSSGLGAVAKRGSQFSKKSHERSFGIRVDVKREIGAGRSHQYQAWACVSRASSAGRRRCKSGFGHTPTSASKYALKRLATALR